MRATEAVLFDLDDTLHDDTAAYRATALHVSAYASERYGIEAPGLVDAYLHEVQHFYEMLSPEHLHIRNQHVQARWWGRALGHYGIRDRAFAGWCSFAFEQSHAKNLHVLPGVPQMLATLRRQGVKLGLLSNGFSCTHRKKIADLGLERLFDEFFLADEVGMIKPDPEVFRYACKRLRTSVECAVMVGDRYERDIIGAKDAGLYTVWVNRTDELLPRSVAPPDAVVRLAIEVPNVLPPRRQ